MKQTPATAQISPLPRLYKAVAPAYLDKSGAFYRSEVRDETVRHVIFGSRGATPEEAESRAHEIVLRCNNHTRLVEALRDAAAGLSVLADDSGFPSRAENVRNQVKEIRDLLASLEQA